MATYKLTDQQRATLECISVQGFVVMGLNETGHRAKGPAIHSLVKLGLIRDNSDVEEDSWTWTPEGMAAMIRPSADDLAELELAATQVVTIMAHAKEGLPSTKYVMDELSVFYRYARPEVVLWLLSNLKPAGERT